MTTMSKRKLSKAARIRKLLSKGVPVKTIAAKLNTNPNYIYIVKSSMTAKTPTSTMPPTDPLTIPVPTTSEKRRGRPPKIDAMGDIFVAPKLSVMKDMCVMIEEVTTEPEPKPLTLWQRFMKWCRA